MRIIHITLATVAVHTLLDLVHGTSNSMYSCNNLIITVKSTDISKRSFHLSVLRHFLNKKEVKPKPIVTCSHAFSRA